MTDIPELENPNLSHPDGRTDEPIRLHLPEEGVDRSLIPSSDRDLEHSVVSLLADPAPGV